MAPGTLTPYALTCEQLAEPRSLDPATAPRFSWRLAAPDGRRGERQTGYRITVTADRGAAVWDSGRVGSPSGLLIRYRGEPLAPATRYRWRVALWDAGGAPAGSAESWFETGLASWSAGWVGRSAAPLAAYQPPRDDGRTFQTRHFEPCLHLRRELTLPAAPVWARLYASARGVYRASVNGRPAGDAELEPGWTDYRHRIRYRAYDVTGLLRPGRNALGAVVGDGWWCGFVGFDPRRGGKLYGDRPAFIAELHLALPDGTRQRIVTDDRWRESPGPLWYSDLLMGEYRDGLAELGEWDQPGYDDTGWQPAVLVDRDTGRLRPATVAPVRVTQDVPGRRAWPGPDGSTIVDLGQNLVGRVRLTVRGGEPGRRIVLRHAEALTDDGDLYLDNLRRAEARDVYVCAGAPVETYEPTFTCHGFRYVKVTGYPGPLDPADLTGRVMHTDLPWTGGFACSDERVNRLHENIRWSQRGNAVSVPTDCPQRDERLGWLADAQVFLPTAARGADVAAFYADWLTDVHTGQDLDGAFPDVAPLACVLHEGAPGWGDAGVVIPWTLYRTYGDRDLLRRCFPAMVRWLDHVHRHNPELVWRHRTGRNYGDWLQVGADTPREVLATAYFAHSARLVAAAARVLGEPAGRFEELAGRIRDAFVAAFVAADGRIHGDTQTCYLLALGFGLLPADREPAAAARLVADLEARGHHLTTGFLGVPLLCPVLDRIGRPDLAHALLGQNTYPSWLFPLRHGATTIWERWDGWTPEAGFQSPNMNSFNHYSLGAVGDWLYGGVAGIGQPDGSVGYEELTIRPRPGRLGWARAWQETPRGRVECGWRHDDRGLRLTLRVPPGVTATVHLPTGDPDRVTEGGVAVAAATGVEVVGAGPGELVCRVGSGRYAFTTSNQEQKERP